MGYHQFIDELGNAYGSFVLEFIAADPFLEAGWYWTACFPGCLNDSDPVGPFTSSEEALRDAQKL
jgi:hypothetical protein